MQDILFIVLGLILLVLGGSWLLKSAVALSLRLNIPKIVIGMTVMMIASLLFFFFIFFDHEIQRYEGVIMVVFLFAFLIYLLRFQKPAVVDEMPEDDVLLPNYKTALFLILGGTALWGGSELLIDGAVGLASYYGVSERVIAITVVSIGTSIPELAASVIAVIKKEKAISLGNLIGSNIFNLLAVLGITSIITPIKVVDLGLLNNDIFWMLGISFLLFPLVFFPKRMRLGKWEGLVLLSVYVVFVYCTIQ